MHRRAFLLASVFGPALSGCRRSIPTPDTRITSLADSRVSPDATFTTPKRPVNLLELFPEVKPLQRITLRLHPRFSDEPAPDVSKLGGRFWWPADEPWPTCEVFKIPLVPVLQLAADDAPPQVKFPPGTDLMQLLWSPQDHGPTGGPKPKIVWRKRADVRPPLANAPDTANALLNYVPVPCRVFPERVMELPDWHTVKVTPLREKIERWTPDGGRNPVEFYERELSVAPGTKVGGYPRWLGTPNPPSCDVCRRGTDYLLTIDSDELNREKSWTATAEGVKDRHPNPTGLTLPEPGNMHVYICRRCEEWPVKAAR